MTASSDPSANGRACACPSVNRTRPSSPRSRTASTPRATIAGLWSSPTTRTFFLASSRATSPVPVATSSTHAPGIAFTFDARKRRHLGSWPNESTEPIRSYSGAIPANSRRA